MATCFCFSALFLALLFCLPEGSLSTPTKLPFQFLWEQTHANHRSGLFRVILKEISLSPTTGGRCGKCDKSCRSYGNYTGIGRSFKACKSEIGVIIVGANRWLSMSLLKRQGKEMGGSFIRHMYGHLPFNGSMPTDQKGKLKLKLRIVAFYDVGENAPKLNGTTDITFQLKGHHYSEEAVVNLTRGDLSVHFTMQISIQCSPGYFPAETCAHYTGCVLSAPCVQECSLSGRISCYPECLADEGPCARRFGHSSSSSADHTLQWDIALGISLFLVCIAAVIICAFLRPRRCSDLTHGRRYLILRNSFRSASLKRPNNGCSDNEGSLSDVAAVHSHVIEASEETGGICEEPCLGSAENGVSDVAFNNLPNGDHEAIKTTSTSA